MFGIKFSLNINLLVEGLLPNFKVWNINSGGHFQLPLSGFKLIVVGLANQHV
jgi:hypothetical protein